MTRHALSTAAAAACLCLFAPQMAHAQRALGVDVSHYQNVNSWATVQAAGISFVFMKSSEGVGYTDPVYNFRVNALHTTSTLLFAPYHFARPASNAAVDEANYFFQIGGSSMKAGNLLPVLDLEDGPGLTKAALSTWAIDFSNRIYALAGVRPIVYVNGDYARNEVDSSIKSLDLWFANPGYSVTSARNNVDATGLGYGAWEGVPNAKSGSPTATEWSFWQYNWKGKVAGIDSAPAGTGIQAEVGGNLDLNVANGDIEYVKKFKIPAIWQPDASGNWATPANWNTYGATLPLATDRVQIARSTATPIVTVSSAGMLAQSLDLSDQLAVTGGTLAVAEYANLLGNTSVSGTGKLTVGTTITNSATFAVTGGTVGATTLANASAFNASGGATTVTGAITGAGATSVTGGTLSAASLTQASLTVGGGTTTIAGAITTTSGTNVSAGTLNLGSMPAGTLAVTGTGLAKFTGTGGSKVASLGVANTADLDVGLTELAVDYSGAATPLTALRTATQAGAILSNKAIAGTTGVGAIESMAKFGASFTSATWGDGTSVLVDSTAVLVALALFGDTNFDRIVNLVDLTALAASYQQAGNWQNGDSTYDGFVSQADLALLGANYGKTLLADGTVTGGNPSQFATDVKLFATIPEPASLAALGLLGIVARRRRCL